MEIIRLPRDYQILEKKNKELLTKIDELTKKNNLISKENISLKYSHPEKNKKIKEITDIEKNKIKSANLELIKEKNELEKKNNQLMKDIEMINKNMREMSEIKESYREKYQRALKELNDEKALSLLNEQKIISLEKKLEELCENNLDNSITRTYKISKNNKDLDKFEKIEKVHHSPQMNHKSISRFSTNQTNSTKKIVTNNNDDNEINPDNYSIIKKIKLGNNLEWYLFKKNKKNIFDENSPPILPETCMEGTHPLYRRYQYLKLNSKIKKEKEKLKQKKENFNDDSYSDFIWKANKSDKNFNIINYEINSENDENDRDKKILELEKYIKELKAQLKKKESDYDRINFNYAKLFKTTRKPYESLLEENNKLKKENNLLNKKVEKLLENQKFISISFIADDLEGSKFIDDDIFEKILDEITKERKDKYEQEIITMKCFKSNEENQNKSKNKENKKDDDKNKEFNTIKYEKKNISKKEYIRNNNHTENRNKNENEEKIKNNVLQEKIRYNLDEKLHRSIRNIRSIKADNDDLNNYDVNSKESIIRKNYKQSMNFDSVMESKDKIKIKYIDKEKNKNEEKGNNNNKLFSVYSRRRIAFKEKEKENK